MKTERETREKLIASAKGEFMEKGYAKASLRKICANAGVTTGALYFFFEDKEDLFRAIVEPPLAALVNMMQEHFMEDEQILSMPEGYEHHKGDHDEIAEMLIHHLYQNYDAFILLLAQSQGTAFENSLERIVDMTEKEFEAFTGKFTEQNAGKQVSSYMIHWMAHMTIATFTHLRTPEREEDTAMPQRKVILPRSLIHL